MTEGWDAMAEGYWDQMEWQNDGPLRCAIVQSSGPELPGRKAAKYIQWLQLSELILSSSPRKHKSLELFEDICKTFKQMQCFTFIYYIM